MNDSKTQPKPQITVAGVTFSADQVVRATVKIENREIEISEEKPPQPTIGFL